MSSQTMDVLIFYDTETTGTQIERDRIIEIAAYNSVTDESFLTYVNPEIPIPDEASKIHGITTDAVLSAPKFPEAYEGFRKFCGEDSILVAHNNDGFDFPLLGKECRRHSLEPLTNRTIDSLKWAQKYRPDLPKHNLQYLRQVYGFAENQAHRALDDVVILHKVFTSLIGDLPPQQVLDLLQQSYHPKVFKMPFGKYKGQPLVDIPKSYFEWLENQGALDKPENKDIKAAIALLHQPT
ncbi:exonuclease, DNA polymerase III, epsilon subunit family [Chlamydia pneumoniae LPCoLN]|uniref:DNA Polymerase III Epsilon Chain n=2 Tax=Chlamydia pneumoniae TaxID=83558 RepID=Q9Z8D3_CHLPN|nr:DNA Polymerase III Epsilon Chain [Chlamydia pneumoniae CWL029]AAF73657.1 DNA polymerase III, epsilon subunit, putative [Chlamydia pneumoniae AR39]ACZ33386.1 exonuclease, DNA polymerase III, epsilon subunit family [Chlamydia pneumoniae LPCoLN]CRI32912.1 Exonuclease, DNA polymerase III, epsilon subunit family [Chlamydia pneumoniae]BAA98618.1 DNA polymerase III epsilon chain [Chlamydia pneumoniae J138]